MEICDINIENLFVSVVNVRKTLTCEEHETGINDLANDILTNGLINPITVRKCGDKYEIIAGQRRYLAIKLLNKHSIPCNILNVDNQKAEEISLVENVQRNQMTTGDKVRSYSKLYDVYKCDVEKVISTIHISKPTIQKYLKIRNLPEQILNLLDTADVETKISIDVAVELAKMPTNINPFEVLNTITTLTNGQKIDAIKQFKLNGNDINELEEIRDNIALQQNNIKLAPSFPYVFDVNTKTNIRIPENLYQEIIDLIKIRTCNNLVYL